MGACRTPTHGPTLASLHIERRIRLPQTDPLHRTLSLEPEDTISTPNVSVSILGGSSTLLESTKTRFIGDGVDSMTADQSQQIVDLIAAEPWCTE